MPERFEVPISSGTPTKQTSNSAAVGWLGSRIIVAGRGSREPVADNNSDAGRAQNRRVEIYVGERS